MPFLLQTGPSYPGSAQLELCSLGRSREGLTPLFANSPIVTPQSLKLHLEIPIHSSRNELQTLSALRAVSVSPRLASEESPDQSMDVFFPRFSALEYFFFSSLSVLRLCSTPTNAHFQGVGDDFRSSDRNVWVTDEL